MWKWSLNLPQQNSYNICEDKAYDTQLIDHRSYIILYVEVLEMRNKTSEGHDFSEKRKREVWEKAKIYPDNEDYRIDVKGSYMKFVEYGEITKYGWEIDHKKPVSAGGGDELRNLQPLFWRNNRDKGDTYPWDPSD